MFFGQKNEQKKKYTKELFYFTEIFSIFEKLQNLKKLFTKN